MTGADLANIRKAAHLTQKELAALVGIGRQAVSYWEGKARVNLRTYALRKIGAVLPLPEEPAALRTREVGFNSETRENRRCLPYDQKQIGHHGTKT